MKRTLLFPFVVSSLVAGAQAPGNHDPSFNASDLGYGAGDGPVASSSLFALAIQADGGILVGGSIDRFNNVQRNNLVRLTPDGPVDLAFAPSSLGEVNDLAVQPDGKILVASGLVYRLLPNGTHDPTFSNAVGAQVRRLQLQPDGRILAILEQAPFNPDLVRLLPNGDPDPSFSFPFSGYPITAMALLPNGQVLAAVDYNGTGSRLLRFNSDGSQDNTFICCPGPDLSGVFQILPQPDGRILVTGQFNTYHGVARPKLVRLESNGSVDLSFDAGSIFTGSVFSSMVLRPDGRILCGGSFSVVQGQARPGLVQLLPNGSVDPAFTVGAGFESYTGIVTGPTAMVLDASGRAVCVGGFAFYDSEVRMRLARLLTNGTVDPGFHQQTGVLGSVEDIAVRSDGRILVAGYFSVVNGQPRRGLARLLSDGSLDPAFVVDDNGVSRTLKRVKEQSTGKVVVMGQADGTASYTMARINVDGSLDPSFSIGSGFNNVVADIAVQADDKVIAAGSFTSFAGNAVGRIVRLLPNGQFDATFNTGSGFSGQVNCVLVQPDGKVLVGGTFSQFNGSGAIRLIRLNSDGTRDNSFTSAVTSDVRTLALRSDGRILVAHTNLGNANRLSCLLPTGTLDPTFNNGFAAGGTFINEIAVLGNGGILFTGYFATIGGVPSSGVGVLTPNGQPDPGFTPGQGFTNSSSGLPAVGNCAALQLDGRILVGGQFTAYDGTGRNRIARLFATNGTSSLLVRPKVLLGGSYVPASGLMSDHLRVALLVPFIEPYSALGYTHVGSGGQQVTSPVLAVTGPNAIVDWVVVELRGAGDPTMVLATRSALVQRDGDVVDVDGLSAVSFFLPAGNYRMAVRHRNHLGAMSASPIALYGIPTTIDLTLPGTPTWGTNARNNVNGNMVLWPGDTNFNGTVKYAGGSNDRDPILTLIGGTTPTNTMNNVYNGADLNLDGSVKYAGSGNDRDIILQTIGGSVPTATRTQQLP
ncbi:MAG: delta-60 repeat domain-containing protein [Flavobacteriales bacterium]|nr:delta-60 repeat domain-containing protein [Flavobacteriales bacterium]MBK9076963.1 delta-60 repeat domain-containing protein [Flavobacteriales bacterium]MBK9538385.1 delta-60 repeat domain-containing protein [Flavobacteriales bacterium]